MKRDTLWSLFVVETAIIILGLLRFWTEDFKETDFFQESLENSSDGYEFFTVGSTDDELLRELSPDGNYTLLISEVREPDFPFGEAHVKVTLFEVIPEGEGYRRYYRASFKADVANDGARAAYKVEWLEDGAQIALSGQGQPTAYYILTFKTLDDDLFHKYW